jgi:hypothetical protein
MAADGIRPENVARGPAEHVDRREPTRENGYDTVIEVVCFGHPIFLFGSR